MDYLSDTYNCDYYKAYILEPALSLEDAFVYAFNSRYRMQRAGIYGGIRYNNCIRSIRLLSDRLIDFHLTEYGYSRTRASPWAVIQYVRDDYTL